LVRDLTASGVPLWFDADHAALPRHGWIDIEALDGAWIKPVDLRTRPPENELWQTSGRKISSASMP
jgi:hypothetical protein